MKNSYARLSPESSTSLSDGTQNDVTIRPSGGDELVDVLSLWRESRGRLGKTDDSPSLLALLDRDPEALLVAELDRRIVGSLIAVWDGWRGNLYRLTVHPTCRRQGIGRLLIEAGENHLRGIGAVRVSALVWTPDDRAVQTWLSAGYDLDEGTGRFVKMLSE